MSAREKSKKAIDDLMEKENFRFDVEVFTNTSRFFIGEAGSVKEASKLVRDFNNDGIIDANLHPINDDPDAHEVAGTHEWQGFHLGFIDMT